MAKILFACINGNGLGHITRILALARQVRKQAPDSEVLVLTTSEFTHILAREGIASVKIPSSESLKADKRLPVAALTHTITAQVVATFRPQMAVVDSMPAGLFGEYLSPLMLVPKRVFIFGAFPNAVSDPLYEQAQRVYGRVLMQIREDEKDEINVDFGTRTAWVGNMLVRSRNEILPRDIARKRIGAAAEDKVVYIGLGGGGNPQNEETLKWLLDALSAYPTLKLACPVQPFAKSHDLIYENNQCLPVAHYPMADYFAAFDFAIAAAGVNNCGELTHAAVPSIWVPLGPPSTDQKFNADRFATKGLGMRIDAFDTHALTVAIDSLLDADLHKDMRDRMQAWSGPNGAEVAAKILVEYLRE